MKHFYSNVHSTQFKPKQKYRGQYFCKKILFVLMAVIISGSSFASNEILFLASYKSIAGMSAPNDVAISPDGKHLYISSYSNNSISIFERDISTGLLTYIGNVVNGADGITHMQSAFGVDVSLDGKNVYVASPSSNAIVTFSRDASTGLLSLIDEDYSGFTLDGFVSVSVSPDGKTVYGIAGNTPDGIVAFSRDETTGKLTFLAEYSDATYNYLGQAFSPTESPINNLAFTAAGDFIFITSTDDNSVATFSRNTNTGTLTFVGAVVDGVDGVDGIQGASSLYLTPDNKHLYVSGQNENSLATFSINSLTGSLTYVNKITDGIDGVNSIATPRASGGSPDGRYVYVSGYADNAITAFERNSTTGLLTQVEVAINGVSGDGYAGPNGMITDQNNRHLYLCGSTEPGLAVFQLTSPGIELSTTTASADEEGPAITLDNSLNVFDSDDTNLESGSITIASGKIDTDTLMVTIPGSVTASYSNGELTIVGSATLEVYRDILRSVQFQTGTDNNITTGESSERTITFVVNDGENESNAVSIIVTVNGTGVITTSPVLTTTAVTTFDATSATLGGDVTSDGGATVTERGVVYSITSTNSNPEIDGTGVTKAPNESGTGNFSESISGLAAGTQYSVRAYAVNSEGTNYGNEVSFTTKQTQSITFNALSDKTYGEADFTLGEATTDKGLTVSYTAADPTVVSISGNTATILKAGGTTITASQNGDATHAAATPVQQNLVVSPKELTVINTVAANKVYEGNASATISGASLSGLVGSDVVTLGDETSGTFAQASVGTDIDVTTAMTITGDDASNYTLTQPSLTADITAKELTITNANAANKVYDGNTTAIISGAALNGVVGSDAVTLEDETSGTFAQENVGTNLAVTTAMTISGADASNYTLTQPSLTADITAKPITVTADAGQTKVYGEADPVFTYTVAPALVSGDSFSGELTRVAGEDVAAYSIAQGTLTAGANYDLSFVSSDFSITQKPITVTADAEQTKIYGEADPVFTYTVAPALVSGDSVSGELTRATGENVGLYAIAQGTLTAGANYDLSFVSSDFSITQKPMTVTADAGQTKIYGEADPVFTYTVAPALVSGDSFSGELTRATGENVGLYAIAQGTLTAGANYDLSFVSSDFSITQKPMTVTADAGQTKIYGEADPVFTYTVAPNLVSGDSFSGELTRATGENVGLYAIAQGTLTAGANYDLSFVSSDFNITQKPITVNADAGQTKIYGEADPVFTYTVAPALVSGDSFSGELTRATGENVGLYAIAQGTLTAGANYDLSFVSSDFSITQKPMTVTADAGQTKIYGEADPVFTYTVAPALVSGDSFSGELTRATGENVGLYAIAQGTLTAGANYDLSFVSSDFSITQKPMTVTADAGQTKIYGEADPVFTYTVAPALVSGDSFSGELTRATGEDVGLYAIAQGTLTAGANYDLSFVSSDFSITQKPITVNADAGQTKIYGEADPAFTYTVAPALVSGDSFSGELTHATGENVGLYAIAQGTLTAGANYDLSFVSSDFSITQKPITVNADAGQTKIYGEADPAFTYTVAPALVSGDSFSGELTHATGENVGLYAIAQGTLTAGANYDLSFVSSDFSITQKPMTVTADAGQTKIYGEADPVFTYTVAPALVSGDSFSGELTRATGENVGLYAIAQGTLTAGANYDLSFVSSDFSITQKPMTVTADAEQTKIYGEADPVFTYTVAPALVSGDSFSGELTRATGENVGLYAIAQGTLTAGANYDLSFVSSDFSITQKPMTVTADAGQTKIYGEADPVFTYTVAPALVSGDSFSGELTRATGEDVGLYAIAQGTLTAGANYDLSFVSSDFSITQKPMTVTADAEQTKIYGEADPVFTYTVAPALVSGDSFSGELTRATGENVGLYAIAQGTLTAGANYDLSFVSSDFSITQKPMTVTADAGQTKIYGEADPVFTYTVAPALVSGDSFSGELTRATGEDVGLYAIAQGTLTAGANYDLSFVSSDFSITQKPITVNADAGQTKIYGEADPAFTYTVAPALVSGDSFSGELTHATGENVGLYAIAQGTLTAGANYDLSFVSSDFSITQKPITVNADAGQTKIYGEADPAFTYTVAPALVSGDSFSGELTHATGENVGLYAIAQGTLTAGANYDLSFVSSDFSITQKPITVTADAGQTKIYGEADPAFTYTVAPALVSGDSFSGELTHATGENVGLYAIAQGTLTAGSNYDLLFVSATFSIEPVSQSISFNPIPLKHLETDADFMLAATASSGLAVSYTYTYSTAEAPATVSETGFVSLLTSGEVEITASQAGNENYLPAEPVTQRLTIKSSDASIHTLMIDGESFNQPTQEIYYQMDCDNQETSITISYSTEANASSSEVKTLVIETPAPGIYRQSISITSQDETQQQTYTITVEKSFNFDQIIEQKYNNVLLVNNNPETNGGYRFVAFKWYKNGQLIGTGQYYSAGQSASNQLDSNATYSTELTTAEGEVIHTCDFSIELNSAFALTASPNPVRAGSTVEVVTNYSDNMLSDRSVQITSLYGAPILRQVSASNITTITLPNSVAPGTYVVTTVASGVILTTKIIVQ